MGFLADGKVNAFFVRLSDEQEIEVLRLLSIFKRTKKNRIKTKIARRIDAMI